MPRSRGESFRRFELMKSLSLTSGFVLLVGVLASQAQTPAMVWIPSGTFTMGSPDSEVKLWLDETQHIVALTKGFQMGKYQVTQGEYQSLIGTNPSYFTNIWQHERLPVESVNWFDASNYCAQLTQQEQVAGRLPVGWVYRLPTESEWEYAC